MQDSFDPSIIIFAVLALFVLYKLRSVLGTRTGNERRPPEPVARARAVEPSASAASNVIPLPGVAVAGPGARADAKPADRWSAVAAEKAWPGLDAILAADSGFSAPAFIAGAGAAYEMIVVAFASGDVATLRRLLEKDVFDSFEGSIRAREAAGHKVEMTFVSLDKTLIDDARLAAGQAQITVRFLSKMINATRDRAGEVVDGSPDRTVDLIDIWTFARPVASRDPNWKLIATESAH
jgi:predicted lipid-binding transport protein (Tim44 family)